MNEKIQHARDVALGLLKPSQKQIEHGLALHANNIVVESYGFAPRTAPDADAVNAAYEAGASEIELRQISEEGRLTRVASDPEERKEILEAFEASGVTCFRVETPADVVPTLTAALTMVFQSEAAVAVLLTQRLIGAKTFQAG